jgi:hypothetical protein
MIFTDPKHVFNDLIRNVASAGPWALDAAVKFGNPLLRFAARLVILTSVPLLSGAAMPVAQVAPVGDAFPASSEFTCNCQIHCNDGRPGYAGASGFYRALTDGAAMSMCLSDATDRCLKVGGIPGGFYRGRCR